MADLKVNFVPTRWWEALNFLRLNFEMVRGCDPLADSILAQPWSPSNLLECGYMLDNFFHTDNYFIVADNQQAGLVSLGYRPEFIFIYSLGLLPDFRVSMGGSSHGCWQQTSAIAEQGFWRASPGTFHDNPYPYGDLSLNLLPG
jgi:hypothetical protein